MKLLYAALAVNILLAPVFAASFDCTSPNLRATEKAVCQIPELSLMDDQLADAYKLVSHIPEVKADQMSWLKERNGSSSVETVKDLYRDRTIELQIIAELEGIKKPEYSEIIKAEKPKAAPTADNVTQLISSFKAGDIVKFKGIMLDSSYSESGPYWAQSCASKLVQSDILPKWRNQARTLGLSRDFASVEWKIDLAMYNSTLTKINNDPVNSKTMCDIVNMSM